jgi:DNA-binding NarL/FixJ family response regulator
MTNINPVLVWAPTVVLVPALVLAAYLYFSLKIELSLMARRAVTRAELEDRWKDVVTELETLRARLAVSESRPGPQDWVRPDGKPLAMNLNRRGQILRLHGKGRSKAEIASDLQISQGEVELMLKVNDWSATSAL